MKFSCTPAGTPLRAAPLLLATILFCGLRAQATVTLDAQPTGIHVSATGLGDAILEYPVLISDAGKPEHKVIEQDINGPHIVLKYDGGGQITLDISDPTQIQLTATSLPDDVHSYKLQMNMELGAGPNRKWSFDDSSGDFPLEKPPIPQVFHGTARTFTLTNYENRTLSFNLPDGTYQDLTDNREWGWNAFFWHMFVPYNANLGNIAIKITEGDPAAVKHITLVDRFGQSTQTDWPDKVKDESELAADVESEKAYYAGFHGPALDTYGGWPGSGQKMGLKATGFFHVEKTAGQWNLVDPLGNAFFQLGVCAFSPGDDYTLVKGREQIYENLPDPNGDYKTAFLPDQDNGVLSFHLLNMIRKYHEPYSLETFTARHIERTRAFGFNSMGAFSAAAGNDAAKAANFPYVGSLPLGRWDAGIQEIPGLRETWDPFDEGNRAIVATQFAQKLPAAANDPLLIGYFLTNEPAYEDIPKVVPTLKGTFACKRRLVQMLQEKYGIIDAFNAAWGLKAQSFDALEDTGLDASTPAAAQDMQDYTGIFLDSYFSLVSHAFHQYDPNHLLLGNRLQPATINNEQLCRIMGKYLDVVSYNYYTFAYDKDFLTRIQGWTGDRPMLLSEFFWSSSKDSGLSLHSDVNSQQERGLAYRNYVEQAAATNFIVGIEWFTLGDQSVTGRWFSGYNGEDNNTGLFSVTDRPWKPAVEEMFKTNSQIYQIRSGNVAPFVWDDPRFQVKGGGPRTLGASHATGAIALDGTTANWPGTPAVRIGSGRLVIGNDAKGLEGDFRVCWDETNLYVLANVTDATPMLNDRSGEKLWDGDGLELFVADTAGGAHHRILIGAGQPNQICFAGEPGTPVATSNVLRGVDGKGYTVEVAVPWTSLGITPKAGTPLAFDLAINDGDGQGRLRQLRWSGGAEDVTDAAKWGALNLSP